MRPPSPAAPALLFSLLASLASAQSAPRNVELTGFGGYQAGGSSSSRLGRVTIDDAVAYGVMLDVRVRPDATLQIVYDRQETVLDFRDNEPFFPPRSASISPSSTTSSGGRWST